MDERPDVEKLKLLARDQIARLKVMQRDVVDELKNANGGGKGVAALVGVEATLGEYDYEVDRDRKMEAAPDLMAFLDALMCSPAYEKEMERLRAFVVDVEEQLAETARRLQSATTAVPEGEEAEQPDVVEWLMEQGCTAAEVVAFTDGAGVDEVGKLLLFEPTDTAVLLRLGIGDATFGRVIAAAAVRALVGEVRAVLTTTKTTRKVARRSRGWCVMSAVALVITGTSALRAKVALLRAVAEAAVAAKTRH
jgi:hypothetical protein